MEVLWARPLDGSELATAKGWLGDHLMSVFLGQQVADQRHGYQTALRVLAAGHDDRELLAAAALHDVGKRHSGLGAFGRTLATVLMSVRLPLRGRFAAYRDHGALGATDLEGAGAPELAVEFARHHQAVRPPTLTAEQWAILNGADLATLPRDDA